LCSEIRCRRVLEPRLPRDGNRGRDATRDRALGRNEGRLRRMTTTGTTPPPTHS
jgi:hypothetical protein